MRKTLVLGFLLSLALTGCSTQTLSDYGTSSVYANISGNSTGGSSSVSVTLQDAPVSLTYLELTSDDSLSATAGTNTLSLSQTSVAGAVSYGNSLNVDSGDVTVALKRKKDSGAPNSVIHMPQPFTLTPPTSSSVSRATALTVTWTSNTDPNPMQVSVSGSCLQTFTTSVTANTSQVVIAANTLLKATPTANGAAVPDSCQATANFQRQQQGTLDASYKGGTITGTQQRSFTFTTSP